jgi:hypothetical protein
LQRNAPSASDVIGASGMQAIGVASVRKRLRSGSLMATAVG